ncbi:MAG TPA: ABC transporter ATP-binding protein [bacterium]|nr:ABC transporter ATP-binding protein [Candidatus Omnitrophota bacterium]HOL94988.1 ABC transporter ATP-binding protein [bacterium]HPP01943.1 ABC transporter ATP-binding protein [bacterium]HXK94061.1 ABC transporter ATP-binding protein [bacterium]
MPSTEVILSIQSVSKIYRMGEVSVAALRDASLDIYDGEFLIVAGPSGSGKSTLLNHIGGIDRPTSGTILFLGNDLSRASEAELTEYRRAEVGFVFQFYNLIPTLTALENVQVATEIARDPLDPLEALRLTGLENRADHFPAQLSGGEQQRVSIARALARRPRLILCDEPTGALDLETSRQILGLLMELNQKLKKTIILITHNNAIAQLGHRVARIRDGAIHTVEVTAVPKRVEEIQW